MPTLSSVNQVMVFLGMGLLLGVVLHELSPHWAPYIMAVIAWGIAARTVALGARLHSAHVELHEIAAQVAELHLDVAALYDAGTPTPHGATLIVESIAQSMRDLGAGRSFSEQLLARVTRLKQDPGA